MTSLTGCRHVVRDEGVEEGHAQGSRSAAHKSGEKHPGADAIKLFIPPPSNLRSSKPKCLSPACLVGKAIGASTLAGSVLIRKF
jgi:hypothetical protein